MRFSFVFLTILMGLFVLILLTPHAQDNQDIKTLTKLTRLPGLAISTSYLEKRVLYYDDYSNKLYPSMKNYSQMDFVYVK